MDHAAVTDEFEMHRSWHLGVGQTDAQERAEIALAQAHGLTDVDIKRQAAARVSSVLQGNQRPGPRPFTTRF